MMNAVLGYFILHPSSLIPHPSSLLPPPQVENLAFTHTPREPRSPGGRHHALLDQHGFPRSRAERRRRWIHAGGPWQGLAAEAAHERRRHRLLLAPRGNARRGDRAA